MIVQVVLDLKRNLKLSSPHQSLPQKPLLTFSFLKAMVMPNMGM